MKKRIICVYILLVILISMQVFAGTNIVKKDGTIYESPVDNDPSDSDFVRAIDLKYNISFECRRSFKTSKGNFGLNYAQFGYYDNNFTKYENGETGKYGLKINLNVLKEYKMKNYIIAYNSNNVIVDYVNLVFNAYEDDLSMMNRNALFYIDEGNPLNISKIVFSIINPGLDPLIAAHKVEDKMISDEIGINKKYPNVYSYYYALDSYWADKPEQRDERYAKYLKDLEESVQDNTRWLEQDSDFYEIQ